MKLGVSYNVFDGTENLRKSIERIRGSVDFISVVCQEKSYYGNIIKEEDKKNVYDLLNDGLINCVYWSENKEYKSPLLNEINKRNIGLRLSKKNGCTHHISMDCDEIYCQYQFEKAKKIANKYDTTFCGLVTYYGDEEHVFEVPEDYFVSFIFRIDERMFERIVKYPLRVDPSRKVFPKNYFIFERENLEMQHYSWIRNDIRWKLENSSARINHNDTKIEKIVNYYNNWNGELMALTYNGYVKLKKIKI